jgi:hypothetical protein
MLANIIGVFVVGLMAAVLVLFELGMIAAGDAFFIAAAIVVVFTGQQLLAREHMSFGQALSSIFTRPQVAYFACIALGAVVTAQVLFGVQLPRLMSI